MHGAALALGQAAAASGEFGHDGTGIEVHGQHVAVVTIAGDHLIAVLLGHLHTDNDSFLPDIQMTKSADEAHAVQLSGFFLESADQKHFTVSVEFIVLVELGDRRFRFLGGAAGPAGALGASGSGL